MVKVAERLLVARDCPSCGGRGEERFCDAAGDIDDRPCTTCGGSWRGGYVRGTGRVTVPARWKRFDIGFDQGWVDADTGREVDSPRCRCGRDACWAVDDAVIEFFCGERYYDGGKRDCGYSLLVDRGD